MFKKFDYHRLRNLLLIITLFLIGIFIWGLFTYDIYSISSESMEDTLLQGDVVLTHKINRNSITNKIVVFEMINEGDKNTYVKRCVAKSGDTVRIFHEQVYINDATLPCIRTMKKTLVTSDISQIQNLNKNELEIIRYSGDLYYISGRSIVIDSLINCKVVLNFYYFSSCSSLMKQLESDSGYVVPDKSLKTYTQEELNVQTSKLKAEDNSKMHTNIFCIGDNRSRSVDSRTFGFVPINNVKGEVVRILYS